MVSGSSITILIILFILVVSVTIFAIIAMASGNRKKRRKFSIIYRIKGKGSNERFELKKSTLFNYDVNSEASLTLSGEREVVAIVNNYSNFNVNVIPDSESNTIFVNKNKKILHSHFVLKPNKYCVIVWEDSNRARYIIF